MKKSYCTPELEVEAFNIFTVFTDSSTGGGQNPGGGAIDPDADMIDDFYAQRTAGFFFCRGVG